MANTLCYLPEGPVLSWRKQKETSETSDLAALVDTRGDLPHLPLCLNSVLEAPELSSSYHHKRDGVPTSSGAGSIPSLAPLTPWAAQPVPSRGPISWIPLLSSE